MNSHLIKIILISCLIFQTGCGIKFKRKLSNNVDTKVAVKENNLHSSETVKDKKSIKSEIFFSKKDSHIITRYYSDMANAIIRKEMIRHSIISKKQEKKLVSGEIIPRDIQIIPLPLKLERRLSSLPLNVLRVQIGTHVILMNVKSRKILDTITI